MINKFVIDKQFQMHITLKSSYILILLKKYIFRRDICGRLYISTIFPVGNVDIYFSHI